MSNLFEDNEIDRIKKARILAMLERAQKEKLTSTPIALTDSNFDSLVFQIIEKVNRKSLYCAKLY